MNSPDQALIEEVSEELRYDIARMKHDQREEEFAEWAYDHADDRPAKVFRAACGCERERVWTGIWTWAWSKQCEQEAM